MTSSDLEFCDQALGEVSRSFSQPIQCLPEQLRVALTCGYLLCRVVDTIEDQEGLDARQRDQLFSLFIDVLDGVRPAHEFSASLTAFGNDTAEVRLARALPRVMRVFAEQPQTVRRATVRWIAEMSHGMRLYSRRDVPGVLSAPDTVSDLERYCYFVAGTVGHLITDLFLDWLRPAERALEQELRGRCESFGIGLQMVNILKDITDDFERGRCYVPRQLCGAQGLEPEQLLLPEQRASAHRALAPLFERAGQHLDQALEYTLAIPARAAELRLFCLLPLWMALETLLLAVGNDAVLQPGRPVKISREDVARIVQDCLRHAKDDDVLRHRHAALAQRLREQLASAQRVESLVHPTRGRYAQA